MADDYDYPTDEQLARIEKWDDWWSYGKHADCRSWLAYVKTLWWAPDWGWREYDGLDGDEPIRVYYVSTGGWSGNESLLSAMQANFIGWSQVFNTHRVGGHYVFWAKKQDVKRVTIKAEPPLTE